MLWLCVYFILIPLLSNGSFSYSALGTNIFPPSVSTVFYGLLFIIFPTDNSNSTVRYSSLILWNSGDPKSFI